MTTFNEFLNILEPFIESGQLDYLSYGDLDGDDFVIFESWDQIAFINGVLNGFIGAVETPYISGNKSIAEAIQEAKQELEQEKLNNPDGYHFRLEDKIKKLTTCLLQAQFMAQIEDPKSIDDFDFEYGFSDEYCTCGCGNCSRIVRTSPDSYSWTPPLMIDGEGYISDECVSDGDFDDYILEQYANEQKSIPDARDPSDLGLVKINEDSLENGLYGGQRDTPQPIIEALNAQDIDVWFVVYPCQFQVSFDVYVKEADQEKATQILTGTNTKLNYDPAVQLEKALRSIPPIGSNTDGITVNSVDLSTGTVSTKTVSAEDFIAGKALDK